MLKKLAFQIGIRSYLESESEFAKCHIELLAQSLLYAC